MAEEAVKGVSPRGSFIIGLVLGIGLGCLFAAFQHQRFTEEREKLKRANAAQTARAIKAQGELTAKTAPAAAPAK